MAAGAGGAQARRPPDKREDLSNYELNSKVVSTTSEGYRIEGLTIAVVLNRKRLLETLGEAATPEVVQARVKEVERLVGTSAGVDTKRGDQISVVAVEFAEDAYPAESFSANVTGPLIDLATGLIKALTVLGLVFIVVTFGLRPVTRMLLEQREAAQVAGGVLAATEDVDDGSLLTSADENELPQINAAELLGIKQSEPNLISDITGDVLRLSQRRLEQMVALDEEQAANILKQWMRERAA